MTSLPLAQFQALASKPRLQIIHRIALAASYYDPLERRPFSGNYLQALQKQLHLSKATISHHISKLQQARMIKVVPRGRMQLLFLDPAGVELIHEFLDIAAILVAVHRELEVFALHNLDAEFITKILDYLHLHNYKVSSRILLADVLQARYYLLWQDTPLLRLHFDLRAHKLTVTQLNDTSIHASNTQSAMDLIKKVTSR